MGHELTQSLSEATTVSPLGINHGRTKLQSQLDQENSCLQAELERLRLSLRLEMHDAFSRFSNR